MKSSYFTFFKSLAVVVLAGLIAACGPTDSQEPAVTESTPEAAAQGKGFTAGSMMAARTAYVFFDAQCPHCATLWKASKPLHSQMKFVWIPVAVLNKASLAQGATILGAVDPVATMNQHEELMAARRGGVSADASLSQLQDAVQANTKLLNSFGVGSIPYVVARHATSGEVVRIEGSLPTDALAARLGLANTPVLPGPRVN